MVAVSPRIAYDFSGMKEALEIINRMQFDGVIAKYAIGGAVGATLYLEPAATLDIDVFVQLPPVPGGPLVSLGPIYEYMKQHGGKPEGEHVLVGGWPVQFLPTSNPLEEEAVAAAIQADVENVPAWIMTAEHLVAIALQTGRSKDHARLLQFLEQGGIETEKLEGILVRHGLKAKWDKFKARFLNE